MTCCHSMAQSKDSLLVYTVTMDSSYVDILKYEYILVFDIYSCKDCVSPKIQKKKKILLIPLDNDLTYEARLHTKLNLKRDYPASDCYFLSTEVQKLAIVKKYKRNQLFRY